MYLDPTRPRVAACVALFLVLGLGGPAGAVPPPAIPLPPCQVIDGVEYGACPVNDQGLVLSTGGSLTPGSAVRVSRDADVGICNKWSISDGENWQPFPCVSGFGDVSVLACVSVDAFTGEIRQDNCSQLFQDNGFGEFQTQRAGGGSCEGEGAFATYIYGGAANVPGATWSERAQDYVDCQLTYFGDRPDGLWGPTWAVVQSTVDVQETYKDFAHRVARATAFVPIEGDMRDLGPVAGFVLLSSSGGDLAFENRSVHTRGESMTYAWTFGDGATSTAKDPSHHYADPGVYLVKLTATDQTGDKSTFGGYVAAQFELEVSVTPSAGPYRVGEPLDLTVTVTNPFDAPAETFVLVGPGGLSYDANRLVITAGPADPPPAVLGAGATVSFKTTVTPVKGGELEVTAGAEGRIRTVYAPGEATLTLDVPSRLELSLTHQSTGEIGLLDVIATLTNPTLEAVSDVAVGELTVDDADLVSLAAGPIDAGGAPLADAIEVPAGGQTTVRWVINLDASGDTFLGASATAPEPEGGERYTVSARHRLVIAAPGLEIRDAAVTPFAVFPGFVHRLDATVANIGDVDVHDIDFSFAGNPALTVLESLTAYDPATSPRIATLTPDESRAVVVWFFTTTNTGDVWSVNYRFGISGTADFADGPVTVTDVRDFSGGIDFTYFWSNLLSGVGQVLYEGSAPTEVPGSNTFGDTTRLGGYVQGCANWERAVVVSLQRGELAAADVADADGLTTDGAYLVAVAREVVYTRTPRDLSQLVRSVDSSAADEDGLVVADWMFELDAADAARDSAAVVALLTQDSAAVGDGDVRQAAAGVVLRLLQDTGARRTLRGLTQAGAPFDKLADAASVSEVVGLEETESRGLPPGVPLSDAAVARFLKPETHAWMRRLARQHGVAFFVSTSTAEDADLARRGFNGDNLEVNYLPVSELDVEWLGYPETVAVPVLGGGTETVSSLGLMLLREPADPEEALIAAIEDGRLAPNGAYHTAVVYLYNWRWAEQFATNAQIDYLSALGVEYDSFGIHGETAFRLDPATGLLVLAYDGLPVYARTGVIHIARPDGTQLPEDLHRRLSGVLAQGGVGVGADALATAAFPDWGTASARVAALASRHARGGAPLLIVQPDVTTLGYIRDVALPASAPTGGYYDLFGVVDVTYEGAAQSCETP